MSANGARVAIVGGGISGLLTARVLPPHGPGAHGPPQYRKGQAAK
jgi:cation diffusion facilitator CzcD-associated flavoprotein CzcO